MRVGFLLALMALVAMLAAPVVRAAEADAELDASRRRVGFLGDALSKVGGTLLNKVKGNVHKNLFGSEDPIPPAAKAGVPDPNGAANRVLKTDERCVICQYLVQRVQAELLLNGVGGGVPYAAPHGDFETAARDAAAGRVAGGAAAGQQHGDPFQQAFTPPPVAQAGNTGEEQQVTDQQQGEAATLLEVGAETARRERAGRAGRRRGDVLTGLLGAITAGKAVAGGVDGLKEADLFNQGLKRPDFLPGGRAWRTPRERHIGLMAFRPTQRRYSDMRDGPLRAAKRAEERYEENQMFSVAYQTLEDLCTKRMPAPYYGYCGLLMKNYEKIAQGLRWKDRPDSICMGMGFCAAESYVQKGPHAVYRPF